MNVSELQNFQFGEPFWLLLLILIPLLLWIQKRKLKNIPSIRFSSIVYALNQKKQGKVKYLWITSFLRYCTIFFLIVSISKPQLDQSTESIKSSGIDIVLAIDLSASMLALDMSDEQLGEVTRLDVVKDVLQDFISKRSSDRIGLVAFSVNPYLVSALTMDQEHLQRNLSRLRVGLTKQTGTSIGSALAEGINRLRPLKSKSKILILLTDGKDEPPPPNSPLIYAEGASKDGIKIYTIAIGSNSRTRTFLFDPSTRDLLRYANGKPVIQVADYPVDKEILKRISLKTNALFFEAKDKKALSSIYEEIDRLEKTEIELKVNALYKNLFQWTLGIAVFTLVLEIVLSRSVLMKIP